MHRRIFLRESALAAAGGVFGINLLTGAAGTFSGRNPACPSEPAHSPIGSSKAITGPSSLFRNPPSSRRPFVRWWWNGNKTEAKELIRELNLLKAAGIGGVEINPIAFPSTGDDLGKKSLPWLSDEWIDLLKLTFAEARRLDLSCDLLVGSGWPYGAETLPYGERAQVLLIHAEKITGPALYETSRYAVFKAADPQVTTPCPGRSFEILSIKMTPDPLNSLDEVTDFTEKAGSEIMHFPIPEGKHVLYILVKANSFAGVINGAPGAAGPVLNHLDKGAVRRYLNHMSDTLQQKTGPLSAHLRAFFTDSLELEGSNWTGDFAAEFLKRRRYDPMPWLPFILFKTGRLGAVVEDSYGASKSPEFNEAVQRVRFDFELTKAELLHERFTQTYQEWCRDLQVRSRAQAYGRSFFPLESSLGCDIPEGESWTTNWLKHRIGEEMPDEDYRRGRAYTMINKFVSSAAHLSGKKVVSCEEMTNTYNVFNATLELLKTGSDQSILSGITHSVWHGFNYSPPEAPFPGWVQYGSYLSENNNWWPFFRILNDYKARISLMLQNREMFADMAILPATSDLWAEMGVQTEPFPEKLNAPYTSILWESISKNGGAADYVSETIIRDSGVHNGKICYGTREYGTLILPEVSRITPESLGKLLDFVVSGGRIFCIGIFPEKSPGYQGFRENDEKVNTLVRKLQGYPGRFTLLEKPENASYLEWYREIMLKYGLPRYMEVETPDPFVMQVRYRGDDGSELFFFANAHLHRGHRTYITFSPEITRKRYGWVYDPETGETGRISLNKNRLDLDLGPAESRMILFDREKKGPVWEPLPSAGTGEISLPDNWEAELRHSREGWVKQLSTGPLQDLKNTEYASFTGTVVYRTRLSLCQPLPGYLNLGKVSGVSELFLNGRDCGVTWYGRRIYRIAGLVHEGVNNIEIRVTTTMGNYMKTLKENPTAQKFTALKTKDQPVQSMGMTGPVTLYH